MSDLYEHMASLAVDKIRQYGKAIVLTVSGSSTLWKKFMQPATGRYAWRHNITGTVVQSDPTIAASKHKGFGIQDRYKTFTAGSTTIQAGDIRLWAISIPDPVSGDLITMNHKTRTIVSANPVQPGDKVIMWDIQLR